MTEWSVLSLAFDPGSRSDEFGVALLATWRTMVAPSTADSRALRGARRTQPPRPVWIDQTKPTSWKPSAPSPPTGSFGPECHALLAADLRDADVRAVQERDTERERHQRTLGNLARRQSNLLRQAQDADPDDPFTRGLHQTYNDLETRRKATLAVLADLDAADAPEPERPTEQNSVLLGTLPHPRLNLTRVPEPLQRRLYEITHLTARLHKDSDDVTFAIQLPAPPRDQPRGRSDHRQRPPAAARTRARDREITGPWPTADASGTDAVRAPRWGGESSHAN
ncbi:hypothetical protein GCM10010252_01460 [Streptomyces aureoverticillatus]|nr:hypothetical protein GCM10010252_01460 [Streptomyces aureoverticillatus]